MRTHTNRAVVRTLTSGVGPVHHRGNLGASRLGGETFLMVAPASRDEAPLWGFECDASGDIRRHQCSSDWSTLSHDCTHLIAGIPSGRINGTLTYAFQ